MLVTNKFFEFDTRYMIYSEYHIYVYIYVLNTDDINHESRNSATST